MRKPTGTFLGVLVVMIFMPKPLCSGSVTFGPCDSTQLSVMRPEAMLQCTFTSPLPSESAPYFAALVAISCTIIDSTTASRGDSGACGPDIRTRSGLVTRLLPS